MADKITIYNLALAHIGESASVVSPDEQSDERTACDAFYPTAKYRILELFDWSFASRTETLAKLLLTETYGWKAGFALPNACIRLQFLRDGEMLRPNPFYPIDWDYEVRVLGSKRILYTDCENPIVGFIASDIDESLFSPSFIDALSWLLASYIAGERVKGKEGASFAQSCYQYYERALLTAKDMDAHMTRIHQPPYRAPWIRAR